jgi:hypothetical protein
MFILGGKKVRGRWKIDKFNDFGCSARRLTPQPNTSYFITVKGKVNNKVVTL